MDKRELILKRLLVILGDIPKQLGYVQHSVFRNRGELPEDKRPAIVLLDGSETVAGPEFRRGRVGMSPALSMLSPQMFVLLKPRPTPSNEGVGEELSAFRASVIRAIATDQELINLCGPNGGVALLRTETDMQTGSTLEGQLRLDFVVRYVLDPFEL